MSDKDKNWILAILLGVIATVCLYKFVMNNMQLTTTDIIERIEEIPIIQDKGIILEEELIIVKKVDR
jgi:hypothetical protein